MLANIGVEDLLPPSPTKNKVNTEQICFRRFSFARVLAVLVPAAVSQRSRLWRPRRPPLAAPKALSCQDSLSSLTAWASGAPRLHRPPWPQPFWNGADKGRAPPPPAAIPRALRCRPLSGPGSQFHPRRRSRPAPSCSPAPRPLALAAIGRVF